MALTNYLGADLAWKNLEGCKIQADLWAIDESKLSLEHRIAQLVQQWDSKSILDIGCGSGRYALTLPYQSYVGIDQSSIMVSIATELLKGSNKRAKFFVGRAEKSTLPIIFDLGLMIHVTQHVKDVVRFMRRIILQQRYKCKRWCFTMLTILGDEPKLFNIDDYPAACANPESTIDTMIKQLGLDIGGKEVQRAVGVEDARELLYWTNEK